MREANGDDERFAGNGQNAAADGSAAAAAANKQAAGERVGQRGHRNENAAAATATTAATGRQRVVIALPSLIGGGAERVMVTLANHLDRERFEPVMVVGRKIGPYLRDVAADLEIHELGAERARKAVPALIRLVRTVKPRTVVATLGMAVAAAIARPFFPRGTRLLMREGNSPKAFWADVARNQWWRKALLQPIIKRCYRMADRVICQSDFMRDDMAHTMNVPPRLLARIYNPIDAARIAALSATATVSGASNGASASVFDGAGPHFLAVGSFKHQKGFDLLVPAFRLVRDRVPTATLTILGDGLERPMVERQAAELRLGAELRLIGFAENPYRYMAQADLLVSSSRYEGLPNVVLEAHACGTPVVATDCPGGTRELIRPGFNGWLCDISADALAAAMQAGWHDAKTLNRAAIRAHCVANFDVARIVKQYEAEILGVPMESAFRAPAAASLVSAEAQSTAVFSERKIG